MKQPTRVTTELLERESELTAFERSLEAAREGGGQVVVVEGAAGIGKTALLAAAVAGAERAGSRVLRASGGEVERELGWTVVRELCAPLVESEGEALFSGAAGLAAPVLGHAGDEPVAAGVDRIASVLHGLYWLVANAAADRPLVVAVDDAQWADVPSLRWLAYLAARVEGLPILVALTLRPDEGGDDALRRVLLSAIVARARLVRPSPLSPAGTGALVRRLLGSEADERFCDACHGAARGNPFLLTELARALASERVPPSAENAERVDEIRSDAIAHTVLVRLARLAPDAVKLATAVAVLGRDVRLHQAAALAGLESDAAADAAAALAGAGVLRDDMPLEFVHPIVRGVVYRQLPVVQRAQWHERAARRLAASEAPPADIAVHLLATEPHNDQWAAETLIAAAEDSIESGALDTAAALLRRALDEPPAPSRRAAALRLLGRAESATLGPRGYATLREAFEAAADPEERAAIALEHARAVRMTGEFRAAVEPLDRALAQLGRESPPPASTAPTSTTGEGRSRRRRPTGGRRRRSSPNGAFRCPRRSSRRFWSAT